MAKKSNTLNDLTKFLEFENIQFSGGSVMKSEDDFLSKTPVSFVNITTKENEVIENQQPKMVESENQPTEIISIENTIKELYLTAVEPFDQFGIMKLTIDFQTTIISTWMDYQRKLWLNK